VLRAFGLSSEGAAFAEAFTLYATGAFIFTGTLFVANATFNNLARPLLSTGANWLPDGVLMLPLGIAFTTATGATGVIWANTLANVITGVVAALLAWRYIRSLSRAEAIATAAA
jgi:hypothetical protein